MKGVFGLADYRDYHREISTALSTMGEKMSLMPWHEVDTFADEAARVGLGRLGIGLFNSGKQPLFNDDKSLVLFMAGEFYKKEQIHQYLDKQGIQLQDASDEELALHLYQEKGKNFVKDLEGIFIIAIWDRRKGKLLLLNDRFGLYPCYYSHIEDQLVFAPSANCVAEVNTPIKTLDLTALSQYIRYQYLLGGRTFFENVHLLPNAAVLEYTLNTGKLSIEQYWTFNDMPPIRTDLSFDEAATEAGRLLRQAVEKRSSNTRFPLGLYLSGGLDSRAILGLIDREIRPEVNTITYGRRDCRDVYYAERIARKMGSQHHWFDLPDGLWVLDYVDLHLSLTEGFHSWIHSHGISTLHTARKFIKVNLLGLGGGLVMSGSDIRPALANAPDDIAWTAGLFHVTTQKNTWPSITDAEEDLLYSPEFYKSYIKGRAFDSFREEAERASHYDRQRRTEYFKWTHCDRRLFQMYTIFYGAFMENRYPFYDYELFEFNFSLPLEYRQNYRLARAVLQREEPSLTRIPYDRDERLPTTNSLARNTHALWMRSRNKIASTLYPGHSRRVTLYANYEDYLRDELRSWAEQLLLDQKTFERGFFQPESIASLLERHFSGNEEWTIGKIAPIMTFEMVMRKFFDKIYVY
jgi:asparagine synthase (glutamine-hydrolysing)